MLAPDAQTALLAHLWPGNVRELQSAMERLSLLSESPVITAPMLDVPIAPAQLSRRIGTTDPSLWQQRAEDCGTPSGPGLGTAGSDELVSTWHRSC